MQKPYTNPTTKARLAVANDVIHVVDMIWEDVPEKRPFGQRLYPRMDSFVEQLRAHPGKTARFPEKWYGSPVQSLSKRYPDIVWEARHISDNTYNVYGTFNEE